MKRFFVPLSALMLLTTGLSLTSCKDKSKDTTTTTTTTAPETTTTAPVEVSGDEALRTGLRDATKDFPTVSPTVANGEVTLTGTIKRADLPRLMAAVNGLNPKKVNNQLTIQ
jgi:osmotically-inducible protein OsmY